MRQPPASLPGARCLPQTTGATSRPQRTPSTPPMLPPTSTRRRPPFHLGTRIGVYMENMGSKILVLFMGLYLGMVFLLTAAAVLALQQLSQAADNAPRYRILARLGAPEKMRRRSVFTQVFLAFFLPWPWRWSMPQWV